MGCSNTSTKDITSQYQSINTSINSDEANETTRSNSFSEDKSDKEYQINLVVEVNENDKGKDIYFLNNISTIPEEERQKKNIHDLLEINEYNTDLFINGEKCKFKKYIKHMNEKIKEYYIQLIFKYDFLINDCSYMFYKCQNISFIDLSKFDTSKTIYMNNMFYGCTNLETIKLSLLFNTERVTSMEKMFTIAKI